MTAYSPPTPPEPPAAARRRAYWHATLRLAAWLLLAWFVVTFGVSYFARELSFGVLGWSFSFWMAAQGALIVYWLLVWCYARHMERLDRLHGVQEDTA